MKIVTRKVAELVPHPGNPRQHPPEQLAVLIDSLKWHHQPKPVVITADNVILAGHGLVEAAKLAGIESLECSIYQGDAPEAFILMDNKSASMAVDDPSKLADILQELDNGEQDMAATGYSEEQIAALMHGLDEASGNHNDGGGEDAPEPDEVEHRVQVGDIWQLGKCRVMCGDSTLEENIETLLNGVASKDIVVLTDPPYGISVVGHKANGKIGGGGPTHFGKVGGGNIVQSKRYSAVIGDDTTESSRCLYSILTSRDIEKFIVWGGNYFTDFLPPSRCWVIWDKENTGNFADAEMAWTSFDKGVKLYRWLWNGLCRKGSRQVEGITRSHPTQKPVGLHELILNDFTNSTDIIVDGFLGSGTTLIASERKGRACYGMELSTDYCNVILARWEAETHETAELLHREDKSPDTL